MGKVFTRHIAFFRVRLWVRYPVVFKTDHRLFLAGSNEVELHCTRKLLHKPRSFRPACAWPLISSLRAPASYPFFLAKRTSSPPRCSRMLQSGVFRSLLRSQSKASSIEKATGVLTLVRVKGLRDFTPRSGLGLVHLLRGKTPPRGLPRPMSSDTRWTRLSRKALAPRRAAFALPPNRACPCVCVKAMVNRSQSQGCKHHLLLSQRRFDSGSLPSLSSPETCLDGDRICVKVYVLLICNFQS